MKLDEKKFPALQRVLAEVSEATKLKQIVIKETGKAVEALYNLEITLNNMHRGQNAAWDENLGKLRARLRASMDQLKSYDLFDLIDKMCGDKDV